MQTCRGREQERLTPDLALVTRYDVDQYQMRSKVCRLPSDRKDWHTRAKTRAYRPPYNAAVPLFQCPLPDCNRRYNGNQSFAAHLMRWHLPENEEVRAQWVELDREFQRSLHDMPATRKLRMQPKFLYETLRSDQPGADGVY